MHGDECRSLTVREAFAAAAMQGILAAEPELLHFEAKAAARLRLAREAWAMADAMLAAQEAVPVPVRVGVEDDGEPE